MYTKAFNYHRPAKLDDAAAAFARSSDARFLAGGQTLIPAMKLRLSQPADIVDLAGIGELGLIRASGGMLGIGAMTRHAEVAASSEVRKAIPALAHLAGGIGDPAVRNRGTLGGSIANNDPAADYPAAVVALDATVKTNAREIAADDFFTGLFETTLAAGEIVREVAFPLPKRAGYAKFPHPASRFAVVGVFVAETAGGVRVAVTGAGPCVFRAPAMEAALARDFTVASVGAVSIQAAGLNSDLHASAEYRAHLVTHLAKRAVAAALERP
jgi:carbon-monoxide dehydrogenase medium subunit